MALVIADRVRETTITTGTGSVTLAGAYTSFQTFSAAIGNGNSTYYTIASASSGQWEVGIGTYTASGNTLSRDTILASSNGGSAVNFSSGAKDVFVTQPAERSLLINSASNGLFAGAAAFTSGGVVYASGTGTLTTGSALTFDGTLLTQTVADATTSTKWSGATGKVRLRPYVDATNGAVFESTNTAEDAYLPLSIFGSNLRLGNGAQVVIDSSGNLGIGTSSPTNNLTVQTSAANGGINVNYSGSTFGLFGIVNPGVSNDTRIGAVSNNSLRFITNNTDRMTLDASGNLGLGVTPSAWGAAAKVFELNTGANNTNGAIFTINNGALYSVFNSYWDGTNFRYKASSFATGYFQGSNGQHQWYIAPSGTAGDAISFTQAMTLDASGNLGIGTSSPSSNLDIRGSSSRIRLDGSAASFQILSRNTADSTTNPLIFDADTYTFNRAGSTQMLLNASGNLGLGVTPSAWGSGWKAFESSASSSVAIVGANVNGLVFASNTYNSGSNWIYKTNGPAANYQMYNNVHAWFTAPSGTAGDAISFTQAMTLQGTANPELILGGSANTIRNSSSYMVVQAQGELVIDGAGGVLSMRTGSTERARIDSSGNLGIGTSSPAYKLEVRGASNPVIALNSTDTSGVTIAGLVNGGSNGIGAIQFFNGGTIGFDTGATGASQTTKMRLDSSGNLGLGVTPSAWGTGGNIQLSTLTFAGNDYSIGSNYYQNSGNKYIGNGPATLYSFYNGQHAWYTAPSGTAGNAISFTQAMTLDSAGRLGIGTTSPQAKLSFGDYIPSDGQTVHIYQAGNVRSGLGVVSAVYRMFTDSGSVISFGQVSSSDGSTYTERARIDSSGNLGLGVTPSAWASGWPAFQVGTGAALWSTSDGRTSLGSNIFVGSGPTAKYIGNGFASSYTQLNGVHSWNIAPNNTSGAGATLTATQAMTLDASGRLGIGKTNPTTPLYVSSTATEVVIEDSDTAKGASLSAFLGFYGSDGRAGYVGYPGDANLYITNQNNSATLFLTNNTERARIDSSGNLLVGTTSGGYQNSNSFALNVSDRCININHVDGTGSGNAYETYAYNGTLIGYISQNGTTAVAYNTTSDYRLKDNQQPLTGSGAFIDALQPKTWNWKADGSKGVGFIAHEVQQVSPGSVVGEKDAVDAEGKPVYQAMEYGSAEFIANIVAELQSLRARVAALEAK